MSERIVVVSGTLSRLSKTTVLGRAIAEAVREYRDGEISVIEIAQLAEEIGRSLILGAPTEPLRAAIAEVENADVLVAVSPVFKGGYSGLFKHFFDLVDPYALTNRPVILGASGGSVRHSLVVDYELRPLFTYLNAAVSPVGVFATSDDFADGAIADRGLLARIDRAAVSLAVHTGLERAVT
ncbi:hypothetical protein Leucomu_04705 [Leucobacter muris]|jgi:FMN reductase|uniref:NADPH-dependent FMN reductase-like domain-containing protein n=1 Tax=Leucobacter muris TaxID=1935379 RepID=A0ABX5QE24_9MICO|nr:CE1759 family FMN reductase [Leucobacter muris]QAB17317.1 hypothetical protein Leucomu_04705 [Leucobacter muris]